MHSLKNDPAHILVCPLDWGLGHTTRCVPLIHELLRQGCQVLLGATESQKDFLSAEFPELPQVAAPPYRILYPEHGFLMPFWLLRETPRIRRLVAAEQLWTEEICKKHHINLVISDNRFGCFARGIPSIYMTHQVRIAFPPPFRAFESLGIHLHRRLQRPFREIWIPDLAENGGLAGHMSHDGLIQGKHFFIGPLTRFPTATPEELAIPKKVDILALLSGPEPQRSFLETKLVSLLERQRGNNVLVRGRPDQQGEKHPPLRTTSLQIHSHLPSAELRKLILQSRLVVCRSGYSTLMDLQALGAKAILVPTPGQTEQEALARDLHRRGLCGLIHQHSLSSNQITRQIHRAHGWPKPVGTDPVLLGQAVSRILSSLHAS
ncbi:MAG TPA: glycosyltransferase [Fibrobacteraceae bacterium]|nr:glycosyltransferase [Fibrobacteraceae bacterium]